jgi:hypothetical protein
MGFGFDSGNTPGEIGFGANDYFCTKGGYSLREMYGFKLKMYKTILCPSR